MMKNFLMLRVAEHWNRLREAVSSALGHQALTGWLE